MPSTIIANRVWTMPTGCHSSSSKSLSRRLKNRLEVVRWPTATLESLSFVCQRSLALSPRLPSDRIEIANRHLLMRSLCETVCWVQCTRHLCVIVFTQNDHKLCTKVWTGMDSVAQRLCLKTDTALAAALRDIKWSSITESRVDSMIISWWRKT